MKLVDARITITYTIIGDYHVLVHMYLKKFVNQWMLLDIDRLDQSKLKQLFMN